MTISQSYILISIVVLAIIVLLVFFVARRGGGGRLTPLAGLAFAFVLAGLFFGENRLLGYGLMGVGVILALIDIYNKSRRG
jgi:hypothetical protein